MLEVLDPRLGRVRLRLWRHLHFQQSALHSMHLIQVERLDESKQQKFRPLWLVWVGQEIDELSQLWLRYLRRNAYDHWYRLLAQRLHWTLPYFATPEQCERWSDLMPLLSWQLWLARDSAADCPLPRALALEL